MQDASVVAHSLVFLLRHPKASNETPMGIAPFLFPSVKHTKGGGKKMNEVQSAAVSAAENNGGVNAIEQYKVPFYEAAKRYVTAIQ